MATPEEAAAALGFADEAEMHRMVGALDLSTGEALAYFNDWKEQDGSRAGLLEVIHRFGLRRELRREDHVMRYFDFSHLPPRLQTFSRPFAEMAVEIVASCPRNPERTVALRKLLEAKDAAVRARLPEPSE